MVALLLLATALETDPRPLWSVRALGSLGGGDLGISGYYGVEGGRWLSERFAVGGRVLRGEQSTLTYVGPSRIRDATLMEANFIAGMHSDSRTFVLGAGLGSAWVEERSTPGLCISICSEPPPPRQSSRLVASLLAGVIVRVRHFALSATVRTQVVGAGWDLLGTLGVGVAF